MGTVFQKNLPILRKQLLREIPGQFIFRVTPDNGGWDAETGCNSHPFKA